MQIEKRIGREKKRCGYAPFNSAQQAIKLRSLRSLRPSGKLPSATCFIAGPLACIVKSNLKALSIILTLVCVLQVLTAYSQIDCTSFLDTTSGRMIYTNVDRMPKAEGGDSNLLRKLMQGLEFPPIPKTAEIKTYNLLSFIVNEDGTVTDVRAEVEAYPEIELPRQATEILKSVKWEPGSCAGTTVPVQFKLPIRIELE